MESIREVKVLPQQNVSEREFILPSETRYKCLESIIFGETSIDGTISVVYFSIFPVFFS